MSGLPTWVYTFVILAMVGVGLILNVIDAVNGNYAVPDAFNAALSIAVGAALGQRVFKRERGDNGDG